MKSLTLYCRLTTLRALCHASIDRKSDRPKRTMAYIAAVVGAIRVRTARVMLKTVISNSLPFIFEGIVFSFHSHKKSLVLQGIFILLIADKILCNFKCTLNLWVCFNSECMEILFLCCFQNFFIVRCNTFAVVFYRRYW